MFDRILLGGSDSTAYIGGLLDGDAVYGGDTREAVQPIFVDANGDLSVCACQYSFVNGIGPFTLTRFNSADTATTNKQINVSLRGQTMTRDSSGNYYIASVANSAAFYLFKLDASGALLWQRTVTTPASSLDVTGIRVDSTGSNVFICGNRIVSSQVYAFVCKITSAGAHSFSRTASTSTRFNSMAIDSSNNIYCCGYHSTAGLLVMKFTSTGTTSFTRRYYLSTGSGTALGYGSSIACDNSFIYVTGSFGTSSKPHVIKMNLTGVIQWSRYIDITPNFAQAGIGVGFDSSSNVYVAAGNAADTGGKCGLFKFDSAGTLQWQRETTSFNMGVSGETLIVKNDNIYWAGTFFSSSLGQNGLYLVKVPADGTRTKSPNYVASSFTVGTPPATINQNTTTVSIGTTAYTLGTPTFTSTNDNMYLNKSVIL